MDIAGLVTLMVFLKEVVCDPARETVSHASCQSPLGLAYDAISPLSGVLFTASEGEASHARLNGPAAWTLPNITDNSFLQVILPRPMLITGLETQGSPVDESWLVSLRLQFSKDCFTFVNHTKSYWANINNQVKLTHLFHNVTVARCIRILPTEFGGESAALRIELLGCEVQSCGESLVVTSVESLTEGEGRTGVVMRLQSESFIASVSVALSTPDLYEGADLRIEYSRTCAAFNTLEDDRIDRIVHKHHKFVLTSSKSSACSSLKPWKKKRRRPLIIFIPGIGVKPSECSTQSHMVRRTSANNERQTIEISLLDPVRAQCLRVSISQGAVVHRVSSFGCSTNTNNGLLSGCGQTRSTSGVRRKRVVGGETVAPGDSPWLVSLRFLKWHTFTNSSGVPHLCGGSLISRQWVLSAAHCLDSAVFSGLDQSTNWLVAVGEHDQSHIDGTEQYHEIQKILKHPNFTFTDGPILYDIALVKLKQPVVLSDYVNPVCLDTLGEFPVGSQCVVAGWGQDTFETPGTKVPFKTVIPILDSDECRNKYETLPDDHTARSAVRIDDSVLCAAGLHGGKDSCAGDSGGPFYCEKDGRWYQVGLVSIGLECGNADYPGIYTRISHYWDWIQDTMENN